MSIRKSSRTPTPKERATLTRIYGDESNWLGVATMDSKKRRTEKLKARRTGC